MGPFDLRSRLVHAREVGMLVRIKRSFEDAGVDCYVLDLGAQLALLAVIDEGIRYDGYQVVRIEDIAELDDPAPHAAFVESALSLRGWSRPPTPPVDLAGIPELLRTASAASHLVSIHTEVEDPGVCWIGQVLDADEYSAVIRSIDPDACWDDEPDAYPIDEITRVDFGGAYEEALWLVANAADRSDSPPD